MTLPLVLVPTPGERQVLRAALGEGPRIELCGFGPIVAAARTASRIRVVSQQLGAGSRC